MTEINREHPDFVRKQQMWRMYRDLYAGGQEFKFRAANYLLRRQKEPLDVYGERLHRVFYENYIGSIVDWFASTLFRRQPSLQFEGGLASGKDFLTQFADDADLRGTSLSAFLRSCFVDALVAGGSHILIDFPESPQSRRREPKKTSPASREHFWCGTKRKNLSTGAAMNGASTTGSFYAIKFRGSRAWKARR